MGSGMLPLWQSFQPDAKAKMWETPTQAMPSTGRVNRQRSNLSKLRHDTHSLESMFHITGDVRSTQSGIWSLIRTEEALYP